MNVKDVMISEQLMFCTERTSLQEAARMMKESDCGALPVVNNSQEVVGIITDRDICLAIASDDDSAVTQKKVGEIMSRDVHSISINDSLETVLKKMRAHQVGRLPVVDGEKRLRGIVSFHQVLADSVKRGDIKPDQLSGKEENIFKTMKALADRYSQNGQEGRRAASA